MEQFIFVGQNTQNRRLAADCLAALMRRKGHTVGFFTHQTNVPKLQALQDWMQQVLTRSDS